jgi:hypothetical protein
MTLADINFDRIDANTVIFVLIVVVLVLAIVYFVQRT